MRTMSTPETLDEIPLLKSIIHVNQFKEGSFYASLQTKSKVFLFLKGIFPTVEFQLVEKLISERSGALN